MGVVLTKTDMLLTLVYRRWSIQMEGAPGGLRKSPENSLETFIQVMLHNITKMRSAMEHIGLFLYIDGNAFILTFYFLREMGFSAL